jgi:hypothetical protein
MNTKTQYEQDIAEYSYRDTLNILNEGSADMVTKKKFILFSINLNLNKIFK